MANTFGTGALQPFSKIFSVPIYSTDAPPSVNSGQNYPIGQVWIQQFADSSTNTVSFLTADGATFTWTTFAASALSPVSNLVITASLTLNYANGKNGVLITNGSGLVSAVSAVAAQVLVSQGVGTAPSFQSLVAGSGIAIAPSGNSISISTTAGGLAWDDTKVANFTAAVNTGYVIADGVGPIQATLPASAVLGDTIEILYNSETISDVLTVTAGGGDLTVPGQNSGTTAVFQGCAGGYQYTSCVITCVNPSGPVWQMSDIDGSIASFS